MPLYTPRMTRDHRADLLRTQAMHACLTAMGAAQVHVFGQTPDEWAGVTLDMDNIITSTQVWRDESGTAWRYETIVSVNVVRTDITKRANQSW